jgi:hypothetical protein
MKTDILWHAARRREVIGGDLVTQPSMDFTSMALVSKPIIRKPKHSFQSPVVDIRRALDADNQFDKTASGIVGAMKMNFSQTKNERLLAFYENIRRQVDLDTRAGGRYRLAGEGVRQYAERLREEIDRRQLQFILIDWPR